MKKLPVLLLFFLFSIMSVSGCSPDGEAGNDEAGSETLTASETLIEVVEVPEGEELVYLEVSDAEASSFDRTPDWAPEPDPMAPADGDMLTRWSSDYIEGPQWIYFDLGGEQVISNVVVRWERAHATEYKIQVSNDAENWKDVYHETKGTGGTMEASFPPVKARYLRIIGLKRVNESWGISIWEVEIYGPASENPGAGMTKTEYLSRGNDQQKAKEAEELLERMAAEPVPLSEEDFQHGVVYTSWMANEFLLPSSDLTLARLRQIGYDTIAIMVPAYQDELRSDTVFTNDVEGGDTPTDEALVHAIKTCHRIGLRVMIKPHVDPRTDEARINIMASEEWFDSYDEFIMRYARLSAENDVEIFCIGTELEATTFEAWTHRWEGLIDKVEQVYDGELTYAANWTEYEGVPFWDRMDYIGIDAYFPLTQESDPTVEQLTAAWDGIADKIEKWLGDNGLTGKGVILTEIGYPSADRANTQPWVAITNIEDQQEQADCLDAVFRALSKRNWFKGYYIWQYFPQDRWSPLGFTVKDKKAEEVLKKWVKELQ
ncbi:MAG: hypothetical protein GF408_03880 [Candidatus Omnitrophica bacterium]|nr:hypothetical protein [Candidatus Omnitrophota bacterium]